MEYAVLAVQPSDTADIARVFVNAFGEGSMMGRLKHDVPPEVRLAYYTRLHDFELANSVLYGSRFTKVVDNNTG